MQPRDHLEHLRDHLEHLLIVLRERDVPITRDDVQWAFDAPNTKDTVVEWVKEHLGADTLLSKEELDLYGKLERNGTVRAIQANHDTSTIRPILDDEIRSALEALKASTLAIEKQNQALRSQQKALLAYREKVEDGKARRKRVSEQRRRKHALEKQHVEMAADELLQGLTAQIAASQQQLKLSNGTLQASVTETLKGDDRLLTRLEGLAGDLKEEDDKVGDSIAERTRKLSAKLADFTAEEIRCRLDRIFLEVSLKDFESKEYRLDDPEGTQQSLEEEMSSLYSEISAVAEMSVHQNFVEPIMKQLVQRKDRDKALSGAILHYITSALAYLISKINEITTRVQNHRSHTVLLKALSDALVVQTVESHRGRAPSPSKQQSPRRLAIPYPPLVSPNRSARLKEGESSAFTDESSHSLEQLLRLLGISMSGTDDTVSIDQRISAAIMERAEIARNQTANLESSTLKVLATYLEGASGTLQLLRDAMYEDSLYGGFSLADQQLEKGVITLNTDVDEIGKIMTDLDVGILHQRDIFVLTLHATSVLSQSWTPIIVKNVTQLGPQLTPDVTNVSRDGGHSVLINGNIVWLYDDTECMGFAGDQLSFISNTAAYADQPNTNVSTVQDFGVVMVGEDKYGRKQYAILADKTVGTGGWIPFLQDELDFNNKHRNGQRVAIWPGTSPTPISTTQAFIFAPLVYVDSKPRDPSKKYQPRGMTLVTITAPSSGPLAARQGGLLIPGTQLAFGGFASLLGFPSTESTSASPSTDRDIYLLGITDAGLQLARVDVNHINELSKYSYFQPQFLNFSSQSPDPKMTDYRAIYLPGTFTSGTIFYSPYFCTFVMIYFNRMVDSTFYIRFLDLQSNLGDSKIWVKGGKDGDGIRAEDTEALVWYGWSPEQKLYISPTGKGGFNYAGAAHPEYFNRRYYPDSLYPDGTPAARRQNDWHGTSVLKEADAGGDGRHVLLSWTSQIEGGFDTGVYEIQLAEIEFDDIPSRPKSAGSGSAPSSSATPSTTTTHGGKPAEPSNCGVKCLGFKSGGASLSSFFGMRPKRVYGFWVLVVELGLLAASWGP